MIKYLLPYLVFVALLSLLVKFVAIPSTLFFTVFAFLVIGMLAHSIIMFMTVLVVNYYWVNIFRNTNKLCFFVAAFGLVVVFDFAYIIYYNHFFGTETVDFNNPAFLTFLLDILIVGNLFLYLMKISVGIVWKEKTKKEKVKLANFTKQNYFFHLGRLDKIENAARFLELAEIQRKKAIELLQQNKPEV